MRLNEKIGGLVFTVVSLLLIFAGFGVFSFAANYDNTTVTAQLNITNSAPQVESVTLIPNNASTGAIDLIDNSYVLVTCNATVNDSEGWDDIAVVNATIYDQDGYASDSPNDENYHYTNISCDLDSGSGVSLNATCSFSVNYYANNASWTCNISVYDDSGVPGTGYDLTPVSISELYALDVSNVLDYGNMSVGTISNDVGFNVTNTGNKNINVTVDGYGVTDGDGLAMSCDTGTIDINLQRYAVSSGVAFGSMSQLTDSASLIPGLTVVQRTADLSYNTTYWKIQVPYGRIGWCNGTIIFTATES